MCGIVGMIRPGRDDLHVELKKALDRIHHRGPDDSGVFQETAGTDRLPFSVGLGHARLSIIDLSDRGHQPMKGRDGLVIILNGEIYNYIELKKELKDAGYDFKTDTDTEVALNAYHFWGEKCVDRFLGMWAMAIWDGKRLFLTRDRMGKKPLYFYHDAQKGLMAFASEIKALKNIEGVNWQPDEQTVFRYLAFAETERNGDTFYAGIKELPAGCSMIHVPGQKQNAPFQYWFLSEDEIDIDEKEAVLKTSELLYDSVRLRLRSDAPLGLSLSGGLDSTLILAIINELGIAPVPVFSAGYVEPGYNETKYIKAANNYFNCKPHSTNTDVNHFIHDFEALVYHLDQPSKLPGPYSQWRVAELAGRYVKVLIDGQGADELAGGYMYFLPVMWRQATFAEKIRKTPDLFLTAFANLYMFRQYPLTMIWERLKGKVNTNRNLPIKKHWVADYSGQKPEWEKFDVLNAMLRHSLTQSSLPALLRYGDRDNMAFGIENRCPFLDHWLVEYVASLPADLKIRNGTTKWIFREIAKGKVPDTIYKRRMKMGFPTPVGEWFRRDLHDTVKQWLNAYHEFSFFRKWIDLDAALDMLAAHASGRADHHAVLWRVLSIGCWLKTAGLDK